MYATKDNIILLMQLNLSSFTVHGKYQQDLTHKKKTTTCFCDKLALSNSVGKSTSLVT